MGYRQQIAGGFVLNVGGTLLRADDYLVQVENDLVDRFTNRVHDELVVLWSSDINPKLPSPLWANGVPYTSALARLILDGASDTFMNSSLPSHLDFSKFSAGNGTLDDNRADFNTGALFNAPNLSAWGGPGDYDNSGYVDSYDYDMWRSNFDSTAGVSADGNSNGVVDAADYVVWRRHVAILSSGRSPFQSRRVQLWCCSPGLRFQRFAGARSFACRLGLL